MVRREVAGETFLVPIHGHLADLHDLFVLNEVGGWIWEHLDGVSLGELAEAISAEFDTDAQQAQTDAESFVEQLLEAGLAETSPRTATP